MLRVDNWLDVASLENVEEDHSFSVPEEEFNEDFFFFFLNLEILNFSKELKILINEFFENFGNFEFFQGIENFD